MMGAISLMCTCHITQTHANSFATVCFYLQTLQSGHTGVTEQLVSTPTWWVGDCQSVAPAARVSGVMSGQTRARRVSSAAVVQKAQARYSSPLNRAARHPA